MQQSVEPDHVNQVVVFNLGDEQYGVDISQVKEIIRPSHITKIPSAPDFVEGVINLRGQITTIVNLRKRFGLPPKDIDDETRIIVVEHGKNVIGMIVDSVTEVKSLSANEIEALPNVVTTQNGSEFLKGMGKLSDSLVILIDLNRILSSDEIGIKVHEA